MPVFDAKFCISDPNNDSQPLYVITAMVEDERLAKDHKAFQEALGEALKNYLKTVPPGCEFEQETRKSGLSFIDLIDNCLESNEKFISCLAMVGIHDLQHEAPIVTTLEWEAGDLLLKPDPEG